MGDLALRQVTPDLFLGQAYVVWFGKPRLVLYFGLALVKRGVNQ